VIAWIVTFLFLEETLPSPVPVSQFLGLKKSKVEPTLQSITGPQDAPILALQTETTKSTQQNSETEKPLSLRSLLTPQVVIAAANYAGLSLVDISFRAIQPLFLSTPIHLGGLGLPPSTIGKLLSIFGVLNGLIQAFFFARIHDRWGSKKVFLFGLASALPLFAMFPIINVLARHDGYSITVWVVVLLQIAISVILSMSYGTPYFVVEFLTFY